jgi:hypothetical protein
VRGTTESQRRHVRNASFRRFIHVQKQTVSTDASEFGPVVSCWPVCHGYSWIILTLLKNFPWNPPF